MRIVAVADTHTRERQLGRLPDGDVFIHAGDLLRRGTAAELSVFAEWLRSLPHPIKIVVAGNSDWCCMREPDATIEALGTDVTYLQDQVTEIGGLRVWGSPWQPTYKDGAFNLPRGSALQEKWALIPADTDVLITHGPPHGIGDKSLIGRIGCEDLRHAVRRVRPVLHLFGHVHGDGGLWRADDVCYANVTTAKGERAATVLDIDPATRVVTTVQVPGPEGA